MNNINLSTYACADCLELFLTMFLFVQIISEWSSQVRAKKSKQKSKKILTSMDLHQKCLIKLCSLFSVYSLVSEDDSDSEDINKMLFSAIVQNNWRFLTVGFNSFWFSTKISYALSVTIVIWDDVRKLQVMYNMQYLHKGWVFFWRKF